ncbi:MAG: hypothetical protein V4733_04065 [Verrucomicrobiota bacterium]
MFRTSCVPLFIALIAASCTDSSRVPPPKFQPNPPYPPAPADPYVNSDPYAQPQPYYQPPGTPPPGYQQPIAPTPPPIQPPSAPRQGDYPVATRSTNPNQVVSPYPPHKTIDVTGFKSGQLARDPHNQKIFRIP